MSTAEVLIVGGGAVGSLLACDLVQQGVPVRLVDSKPSLAESDPHSRAVMIWPRVLELLEKTGITAELVARGRPAHDVSFFAGGRRLGTVPLGGLDTPYPFGLGIVQRELEDLLWDRLAELGGRVECGTELIGLDNTGPLPRATLRHRDGRVEEVTPQWLVGADGAGSATRRLLGIGYPGLPFPVGIALGDFPIEGPAVSGVEYHYGPTGLLPLVHLPDGICRLATIVPPGEADWSARPLADWQAMVEDRASLPYRLGAPLWTRTYHPRPGVAERFRAGRVLLAGDAAHSVVPLGGQGLNLGLQDALNLGWKLAGVVRGRWDQALLDGYDTERRQAVEQVRAVIRTEMELSAPPSPQAAAERDAAISAAERSGFLRAVAAPLMSQLALSHAPLDGPLWRVPLRRRPAVGDRVPLCHATRREPAEPLLDQAEHLALLWPGERCPADWRGTVDHARRTLADRVATHDLGTLGAAGRGRLRRSLGPDPLLALVRPDGHLAQLTAVDRPQDCLDHLDQLHRLDQFQRLDQPHRLDRSDPLDRRPAAPSGRSPVPSVK
ncbi:FAD-dependent oxidoreductase [Kitasatospora sp. LaBMicrA B282]|uniref:FAD-dependent oxidoreductase n=1 Tax=Kitasatospora sp. LaBMicrA B282 TaxID=3420949 RepID=UPI003D13EDC2